MASTKKACAPALMNQEDRFLSLLGEVQRFDIGRHGELLLVTGDGPLIRAFQSTD
jgi:heat shock protein HslJ